LGVSDSRLIEGVITNLPLFAGVPAVQARSVAAQCWAMSGSRGAVLAAAGTRLPGVFAVAYGSVKLSLKNGGNEERVLRLVAARQMFGEASALLGRPAPYAAVVLAEAKVVVMPSAPLYALLERESAFAKALVAILAERKLELCAEIGAATLRKGAERLASYLVESAGNDDAVQLPFSKTVLAARLGMQKETLSRLLRSLAAGGMIAVSRRRIALLDRARLRQSAGS
jgi:CRP/FNR family transcriptional regulator, dissimilatory nitrate respiration regulator